MPTYTVKSGDTLSKIASQFGASLSELKALNPHLERGKNFNLIYPGDIVYLPEKKTTAPTPTPTTTPTTTTPTTTITQQQLEIQRQIAETQRQLEEAKKQYQIIQEAKEKGMPVVPQTTVEEAKQFLETIKELEKNPYYRALTAENKQLVNLWNYTQITDNTRYQRALQNALGEAEKEAAPYWREQIRILKDELQRTLGTLGANLEAREKDISTRIRQIEEDLIYEKQYLTAEQQADLAKLKRKYENELMSIREKMAQRGLTVSSIRSRAESLLETEYGEMVESTQRKYARTLRGTEETARRQIEEYQRNLEELRRKTEEEKIGAVRKTEAYLGSEELKGIPGLSSYLLGGVYGRVGAEKQEDIWRRAGAYMSLSGVQGPSF